MKLRGIRKAAWLRAVVTVAAAASLAVAACVGDDPSTGGNVTDAGTDGSSGDSAIPNGDGATEACSGTMCGSKCVDLKSDPNNCGNCGTSCTSDAGIGFACVDSVCGNKVTQVAAGNYMSCVLLLEGSVWCWGDEGYGEIGIIGPGVTAVPQKVAGVSNVVEVRAVTGTVCARDASGDVWCWGDNTNGTAGQPIVDGGTNASPTPKKVALPATEKAAQLAGSMETICARTQAGNVFCWGENASDLLGLGTTATLASPTPVQIPVFSSDAIDIDLGYADSAYAGVHQVACGVRADKTVWCWGSSQNGELGHNGGGGSPADIACTDTNPSPTTYDCNPTPQPIPDPVSGNFGNAVKVRTRNFGACALRGDGTVWCWGQNTDGELGIGTSGVSAGSAVPSQVITNGAQLATGDVSTLMIDTGGGVHAWGAQVNGVFGTGAFTATSACADFPCEKSPILVTSLSGIAQISLLFDHALALKTDGTVLGWGRSDNSVLGRDAGTNGDTACPMYGGFCNPTPASPLVLPWQ